MKPKRTLSILFRIYPRKNVQPSRGSIRKMVHHTMDLKAKYGPNFGPNFNPQFRNIITKQTSAKTHHCQECNDIPTKACWKNIHLGFCCAKVERPDGMPQICGERFTVKSKGCSAHPNIDGHNQEFQTAKRGLELTEEEATGCNAEEAEEAENSCEEMASEEAEEDWKDPEPWRKFEKQKENQKLKAAAEAKAEEKPEEKPKPKAKPRPASKVGTWSDLRAQKKKAKAKERQEKQKEKQKGGRRQSNDSGCSTSS